VPDLNKIFVDKGCVFYPSCVEISNFDERMKDVRFFLLFLFIEITRSVLKGVVLIHLIK